MELKIDLLKNEIKSQFRLIVGILLLMASISMVFIKLKDNPLASIWDWLFALVLFLSGISSILGGAGFAFARMFGRSFIHIDEHFISIKSGLFEKEQKFMWSEIKSMEYMANRYRIILNNDAQAILNLSKMEYLLKMEVKNTISNIAAGKGIKIS